MSKTFQQIIDDALRYVPHQHVEDRVHFRPVGEGAHQAKILSFLENRTEVPSSEKIAQVHVGVAGGFNFSIAIKTRPDKILLLDMNKKQKEFWGDIVKLLQNNDNPDDFYEAYHQKVRRAKYTLRNNAGSERDYLRNADWMEPDAYNYLRQMALGGNIAAATLDIVNDTQAAVAIGRAFKQNGMQVNSCYWSNIATWFYPMKGVPDSQGDVFDRESGGLEYRTGAFYPEFIPRGSPIENPKWDGSEVSNRTEQNRTEQNSYSYV